MNTDVTPLEAAVLSEIRAEIARKDWTQAYLAEQVGVGREALNRYLKGRTAMPLPMLVSIADAFELSVADLVGRAEGQL